MNHDINVLDLFSETYAQARSKFQTTSLLNTDMKRELDHLATFMHMAVDYASEIGFTGQFLIEPKPKEPTKHQYDFDAATVMGFLRTYDLAGSFKLNLEATHATLAGHSFQHELASANDNPERCSGRQEKLENILNQYILDIR